VPLGLLPVLAAMAISDTSEATISRESAAMWTDRLERTFLPKDADPRADVSVSGEVSKHPPFAWDLAVTLSAYAAAMRLDAAKYQPRLDRWLEAFAPYGATALGGFAYSAGRHDDPPDRYYDDNEWIALALLEANEVKETPRYVQRAEEIWKWLLSAESQVLGGGLFWQERKHESKNTCSNAPAIVVALKLYRATHKREYLEAAQRLYAWMRGLQDKDGLFFDNVRLDGHIGKTKWTYNSALMIRANTEFYALTHEAKYRDEALRIGRASLAKWQDPSTGAIHDEGPFAHHLADAWRELGRIDTEYAWKKQADRATLYAMKNGVGPDGWAGLRWDRYEVREGKRILLYQSSLARGLWSAVAPN